MKIKDGFAKRKIAGSVIVVPVGATAKNFNAMITLNETGSFFWDCLKRHTTVDKMVKKTVGEYNVSEERARADIEKFVSLLRENQLIEE